jgi:hypothetical protein
MGPPQPIGVNPEQLRNQVEIYKVDVGLREREIFTLQELGKHERAFWAQLATANGLRAESGSREMFRLAHEAHESAVVERKRLDLSLVKASLAISEAALAEADRLVQSAPDQGKVVLS